MTYQYETVEVGIIPDSDLKNRLNALGTQGYKAIMFIKNDISSPDVIVLVKETI